MVTTLKHVYQYIEGQRFHLQTVHRNMLWLSDINEHSGRIGRWVLHLSEYDAVISHHTRSYAHRKLHVAEFTENYVLGRNDHTEPSSIC